MAAKHKTQNSQKQKQKQSKTTSNITINFSYILSPTCRVRYAQVVQLVLLTLSKGETQSAALPHTGVVCGAHLPCVVSNGIAEFAGLEFAGLENDGLENDGVE